MKYYPSLRETKLKRENKELKRENKTKITPWVSMEPLNIGAFVILGFFAVCAGVYLNENVEHGLLLTLFLVFIGILIGRIGSEPYDWEFDD